MPETEKISIKSSEDLIDVGETVGAEIELDEKETASKPEVVEDEKIEVEQVGSKEESVEIKKEEEDKKEDELEKYSEGVQKRIAKLTRKMREAERQKEEAIQFAQLTKVEKERLESKIFSLDKSYTSEFESRLKTGLAATKLALKNAIESQNVEAQIAAQEQLANLAVESSRLNSLKIKEMEIPQAKEVNITPQRQMANVQTDSKAEEWAINNSWFGNDSAMTYTAFDIHKKLVEEEGYDPKSNEYYEEIDKRIRLDFPHKFDKILLNSTTRAKPAQNVASAKRSASTGRKNTVKLTPSQVAIAKRLGVPLEDYARQLKITEGV